MKPQIQAVWQANMQFYGADEVWQHINREGTKVVSCSVERFMKRMRRHGVQKGKIIRTIVQNKAVACPLDRLNRQFKADRPKQRWVSDFICVKTWQDLQYVAFVIDVFDLRILGWRMCSSMRTDFVLDALEQDLFDRRPERYHAMIELISKFPSSN